MEAEDVEAMTRKEIFEFANIPEFAADQAFAFHEKIAQTNGHIWPRTKKEIHNFCINGALFGVRRKTDDALVALCYVALDAKANSWEVGGLAVEKDEQNLGIGTLLVKMAIAFTVALEPPEYRGRKIIAHVHEANEEPRKLLEKLGFRFFEKVEIPPEAAPPKMKRNAAGKIVGDTFDFSFAGLKTIHKWLSQDFDGSLGKGKAEAHLNFGPGFTREVVAETLRQIIAERKKKSSD